MPFVSKSQRRALWAKNPAVAREFAAATPKGAQLPEHVKKNRGQQVTGGFAAEVAKLARASKLPK